MLKIVDRYVLKEMAIPFLLATVGFLIFFLLFLMGRFSQLLVDRVIPPGTLFLMLFYQLPYLLVLALPVATLFAIFLALGRLGHDREIIALQASGISLRRILAPLIVVGILLSGADLMLSDQLAPWGNRQFLTLYVQQFYGSRATPQIRDNAFFKGADDRFFYVRHYDSERNILEDVLIYDLSGKIYLQDGGTFPKVITARNASWQEDTWQLSDGVIHTFDDRGNLQSKATFATMRIQVGAQIQKLVFEQRTPSEMSLAELAERIETFRTIGRPAESLIVDYHLKIAIPVACFVFALFGAPLSLLIGPRGRALGVILSVLLVLSYQGLLFWTAEILGNRGDLPPAWGAWLPNVLFGAMGLVLFWKANRLGRIDLLERAKRLVPWVLAGLLLLGIALDGTAQPGSEAVPIEVSADSVTVSEQWKAITAEGHVRAQYHDGTIEADTLKLLRTAAERWEMEASHAQFAHREISGGAIGLRAVFVQNGTLVSSQEIVLTQSASVKFTGGRLSAQQVSLKTVEEGTWEVEAHGNVVLEQEAQKTQAAALRLRLVEDREHPTEWRAQDATVEGFAGESDFVNSRGETHRLRYQGEQAHLSFTEKNDVSLIDVSAGNFTTCTCEGAISDAAYSIRAGRLLIRPKDALVAFNITLRAFGFPIFWAPAYVAPLTDIQQKYPFIPEIGSDAVRGWFAKWRVPVFIDEENFGVLLLDYYSRASEVGTGLDLNYRALPGSTGGRLSFYRLVGREDALALDWSDRLRLSDALQLHLATGLRTGLLARETTRLLSQAMILGEEGDWTWRVGFSRDQNLLGPDPDLDTLQKLPYLLLERFPEVSLQQKVVRLWELPLRYSGGFDWGRYREEAIDASTRESSRFEGRVQANVETISFSRDAQLDVGSGYRLSLYQVGRRESWETLSRLSLRPLNALTVSLDYLYRGVRGQSPFQFDQLTVSHRSTLRASWSLTAQGSLQINTGYDWAWGSFDPLGIQLAYRLDLLQGSMTVEYDLRKQALKRWTAQSTASGAGWRLSLNSGYDFGSARFDDLITKLDFGQPLRVGARFDLNQGELRRVNLESSWALADWELAWGGEYDLRLGRLTAFRFGVVKKFCQACWQIGFYGNQHQFWVQARINAFPTAEIGYSPTDQSLSFGR
jgi:lipopolysaccharide export system permease protein